MQQYDVIIIGSGPAGYVAAIRAGQLKMKVLLIERENLGGVCLNWGCIPTKALLHSANSYNFIKNHVSEIGIEVSDVSFNLQKIVEYSRSRTAILSNGVAHLMKKNNVEVVKGNATLKANNIVSTDTDEFFAQNIVIATGVRPREIENITVDGELIWDYHQAMVPQALPESLLVIGSGAIGMEFANFYNTMGSNVTVMEMQDRILPNEDHEISQLAMDNFTKQEINIKVGVSVNSIEKFSNAVMVHVSNGSKITASKVLVAAGIVGNYQNLGLENYTDVIIEKDFIVVNEYMKTGNKSIYAIGDVAGPPCLAHKASHEAVICIEKIMGLDVQPLNTMLIPSCTYTNPQIASVGFSENRALELGYDIKVGRFNAVGNGKAIVLSEDSGFVKTIFDKNTGELLGAHMIGSEVTEMIQGYVIGKSLEGTDMDYRHIVFAHPTMSEMMHEAVLDADNESLHS